MLQIVALYKSNIIPRVSVMDRRKMKTMGSGKLTNGEMGLGSLGRHGKFHLKKGFQNCFPSLRELVIFPSLQLCQKKNATSVLQCVVLAF